MAYIDDERYSRVNPEKMLDVADKLELAIGKMEDALDKMHRTLYVSDAVDKRLGYPEGSWWSGEAHELWKQEFDGSYKRLSQDLKKYKEFPRYIRTYAEIYLKAAVGAEQTGKELGENVRRLLQDVYDACDIPVGTGTVTIKDVRSAAKIRSAMISELNFNPPPQNEEQ